LESYIWPADFSDGDIMNDQFAKQWVSWLWHKVLDDIWTLTPEWTFRNWEPAKNILNEITWEIDKSISESIKYDDSDSINDREIRIKNIVRQLSMIFTYIKNKSNANLIKSIKDWDAQWFDLKRLWISNYVDELKPFSIDNLANLDTTEVNDFINRVAKDILDWKTSNNWLYTDFDELVSDTKTKADNITSK
jgi:hypothetical protein